MTYQEVLQQARGNMRSAAQSEIRRRARVAYLIVGKF